MMLHASHADSGLSSIHRWDPALKIVGFACLILAVSTLSNTVAAMAALVLSILLLVASRIPVLPVLRRLRWLALFLLPLFVLLPLEIGPRFGVGWDPSGVLTAWVILVRALSIAMLLFPMWGTAPLHVSLNALIELRVPPLFVHLLLFTHRYIAVYIEQLRRMRLSLKARGFSAGLNLRSFHVLASQVGMLLVTGFEQAERVLSAMRARGYDGTHRGGRITERTYVDWALCAAMVLLSVALVLGDRRWL